MAKPLIQKISQRGLELLREPLLNKGSAFTSAERKAFGLEGLLPYRILDIDIQAQRFYEVLERYQDPMGKYVALAGLQDRNEHLYFYLLQKHLDEFLPIVYTPTIGMATKRFSQVFQRGRGAWITPAQRGTIQEMLVLATQDRDIRLIVATDNESILGIGDQGAGGIKISIGKLSLYTAAAGIDPATVLPISLDVGTQNQELLDNPAYLGWPHPRLRGAEYESLVDEFISAVKTLFPKALVQWEDFRKDNALRIMERYRDRVLSFNDDIQGTGAVALAGMLSAQRIHGRPLCDERVLIVGAGAAGLGISRQIKVALAGVGVEGDDLQHSIVALDSQGLIVDGDNVRGTYKAEMAWSRERAQALHLDAAGVSLLDVCKAFKPTVLIGTSGQRNAFSEDIIRAVSGTVQRPVIMPLSNPTDQSEAEPADVYQWSEGRALVAAGSPFPAVNYGGRTYRVGQGNNAFIFPGIGLGAILARASVVSDSMFYAAAKSLAAAVTDEELAGGCLYPGVSRLNEVALEVARAVMRDAASSGVGDLIDAAEIESRIDAGTWSPVYREYVPAD